MIDFSIQQRTVSAFPLSVGTSLAFESIFDSKTPSIDPARIIPDRINISDYQEFWINVSTLYRNLIGSIQREQLASFREEELCATLVEEVEIITSLLKNEGRSTTTPIFYICDYRSVYDKYLKLGARMRGDTTDKQKEYSRSLSITLNLFFKQMHNRNTFKIFKGELKPENKTKSLILTHHAWDLTSDKNFRDLHLIESHTGKLKKKNTWYAKYSSGKDLVMIPFMKGLFPVFGDNELFLTLSPKLKREITELAKEKNWTAVTTEAKVLYDIEHYFKDKFSAEIVKSFFH